MSKTLNLVEILLTTGRNLVTMGRFTEALVTLNRLAEFRKLPGHVLEELHSLRADIHLQQQNYPEARRCLTAALAAKPLDAKHHFLMAIAIEEDEDAELKDAEAYFDRAVELDPENSAYWVDFGSYLFKIGKAKEGLKAIRKAYNLDTTDVAIVGQVADILRREGHPQEATTKLRTSLFESHGAQAFRQLCQQHQFALIHSRQQESKPREMKLDERAVILPFTAAPTQGKFLELGGRTFRLDQAEPLDEPKNTNKPAPYRRPPKG